MTPTSVFIKKGIFCLIHTILSNFALISDLCSKKCKIGQSLCKVDQIMPNYESYLKIHMYMKMYQNLNPSNLKDPLQFVGPKYSKSFQISLKESHWMWN